MNGIKKNGMYWQAVQSKYALLYKKTLFVTETVYSGFCICKIKG